jgi:signal peptidase I
MSGMDSELEQPTEGETAPTSPYRWLITGLRELLETVIPAVVIAALIHVFLAQATRVHGQSMEPNLHTNQRLIVEKVSYRLHGPRRGDVVVLEQPGCSDCELLIKRVVGLAGEEISVSDGKVYADGQPLDEPYLAQMTGGRYGPVRVPPLHVLVFGDNRGASNDSRAFGPVHRDEILGRAWVSYWPLDEIGVVR